MRTTLTQTAWTKTSGYIMLTLLFALIGGSALWFAKNASSPDYTARDYATLSRIKSAVLSHLTIEMNALSSTSTIGGLTDYPGVVICPLDDNKLGITDQEGYAKSSCHDASTNTPSKGLLPWRSLGLDKITDAAGAMFWLMVDPEFTEGKKTSINSELNPTLYWQDNKHPVVAIIISPQKPLSGQVRAPLSSTKKPIDNIDHYLELETLNETLDGRSIKIVKPSSNCQTNNTCNDLFVTISRNEWLDAIENRTASLLLYCINMFIDESQKPKQVLSSDPLFPASLPSSYASGFCYSNPYPLPESTFSGASLGRFKVLNDLGPSDPNRALFDTIQTDQKKICRNIFNRYTTPSLYPSFTSSPITSSACSTSSLPSVSVSPLPSSFPDDTKNKHYNAVITPTVSSTAHTCNNHWMYQWNNLIFFDIQKTNSIKIKDTINNKCWQSNVVVVLASEPLTRQNRPSTPMCRKNEAKPPYTLADLDDLFEGENVTPSAGFFEIRPRSSEFNDMIRFNRKIDLGPAENCP